MAEDPTGIDNWRRLDAQLTTSGQPSEAQLAALAALGVEQVVNLGLHTHEKALADEATSVAALGMAYTHIPVDFERPRESDYLRFAETMRAIGGRTVHVHCIANFRVSAFLYRLRAPVVSEERARAEMESVWRPGGTWARLIGDDAATASAHRIAGQDY